MADVSNLLTKETQSDSDSGDYWEYWTPYRSERGEFFVLIFSGSHMIASYHKVLNITTVRNCWHHISKFNRYSRKLAYT